MSYVDLSGVVKLWAEQCAGIVVYEHIADSSVKKTHCHFLIIEPKIGVEQFKNIAKKLITPGKGQAFWKWESKTPPDMSFITYMSKGKLMPSYTKWITDEIIEYFKGKWVEPNTKVETKEIVFVERPKKVTTRKELLSQMLIIWADEPRKSSLKASEIILNVLRSKHMWFNDTHVNDYMNTLLYESDRKDDIIKRFANKYNFFDK